ncbi:hypothetical protein ACFFK0_09480 [Paenibacillus chartarius]|uniref:Uncharacterized protein n=1 Tax=Paenibacillus chartarius TaxID=747481 RepID=A0ABV6DJ78_9BACL
MDDVLDRELDPELQLELLKLEILQSLARSERALSRISECLADQVEASIRLAPGSVPRLQEYMQAIAGYERYMAERLAVLLPAPPVKRRRIGRPAPPWLHPRLSR